MFGIIANVTIDGRLDGGGEWVGLKVNIFSGREADRGEVGGLMAGGSGENRREGGFEEGGKRWTRRREEARGREEARRVA